MKNKKETKCDRCKETLDPSIQWSAELGKWIMADDGFPADSEEVLINVWLCEECATKMCDIMDDFMEDSQ